MGKSLKNSRSEEIAQEKPYVSPVDNAGSYPPTPEYAMSSKTKKYPISGEKEKPSRIAASDQDSQTNLSKIKTSLSLWLKAAYQGRISIADLYEKGSNLLDRLTTPQLNALEGKTFVDLRDAFDFIEDLHDSEAIRHNSNNKEKIYYYMRRLA